MCRVLIDLLIANVIFRTGIAAGKTIIETGTDLLKVDVSSKKIYEAVTSQDSLYYNWQLGYTEGYTEQPKN